ncbi:MAG: NUDIX domain-containing protein [Candidatus Peribacteria bacterium]|jgi:putative (di)nucleoside polyphosphate hydrolase|nr:NUDIX domain-containing protein [Candidatus Peribacteria bacterium]
MEKKFRKGVGAIILNRNDEIIAFNRSDFVDNWQGIEGGMEDGETPLETLYRESFEEIGLERENFKIMKETKDFIKYILPKGSWKGYDGQEKKFYLLKIIGDFNDFKYDNTSEVEFTQYKIVTVAELLDKVPEFKRELYKKVVEEFGLK